MIFHLDFGQVQQSLAEILPEIALPFKKLQVDENNWTVPWQIIPNRSSRSVNIRAYANQCLTCVSSFARGSHLRSWVFEAALALCRIGEQGVNFMRALVPRLVREMTGPRQWKNPVSCHHQVVCFCSFAEFKRRVDNEWINARWKAKLKLRIRWSQLTSGKRWTLWWQIQAGVGTAPGFRFQRFCVISGRPRWP